VQADRPMPIQLNLLTIGKVYLFPHSIGIGDYSSSVHLVVLEPSVVTLTGRSRIDAMAFPFCRPCRLPRTGPRPRRSLFRCPAPSRIQRYLRTSVSLPAPNHCATPLPVAYPPVQFPDQCTLSSGSKFGFQILQPVRVSCAIVTRSDTDAWADVQVASPAAYGRLVEKVAVASGEPTLPGRKYRQAIVSLDIGETAI
jgi:hypothetical protein